MKHVKVFENFSENPGSDYLRKRFGNLPLKVEADDILATLGEEIEHIAFLIDRIEKGGKTSLSPADVEKMKKFLQLSPDIISALKEIVGKELSESFNYSNNLPTKEQTEEILTKMGDKINDMEYLMDRIEKGGKTSLSPADVEKMKKFLQDAPDIISALKYIAGLP
jgi:uncharacterized protein YdcH (DUF465 family)